MAVLAAKCHPKKKDGPSCPIYTSTPSPSEDKSWLCPWLTSLLVDTEASSELQQGDGLVFVQVTVVGELACTPLGLGFLLDVALERLHLLLVDVVAAVVVQLSKVPVHHSLLQRVTGVWLHKPAKEEMLGSVTIHVWVTLNTTVPFVQCICTGIYIFTYSVTKCVPSIYIAQNWILCTYRFLVHMWYKIFVTVFRQQPMH